MKIPEHFLIVEWRISHLLSISPKFMKFPKISLRVLNFFSNPHSKRKKFLNDLLIYLSKVRTKISKIFLDIDKSLLKGILSVASGINYELDELETRSGMNKIGIKMFLLLSSLSQTEAKESVLRDPNNIKTIEQFCQMLNLDYNKLIVLLNLSFNLKIDIKESINKVVNAFFFSFLIS
jgi:hypothetical protein